MADGLRRLSAAFGVGVTSFGLTADALDELPRPANILNAHPRETEAIMAKLENRFGLRFLQPATDGSVDAVGNPRYEMVPRERRVVLRLAAEEAGG